MTAAPRYRILVCRGPECGERRGSADLHLELRRLLRARGLEGRVDLAWQSCFGRCQSGPNILVSVVHTEDGDMRFRVLMPTANGEGVLYSGVRADELGRLLEEHVVRGRPVRAMVNRPGQGSQ